MLKYFMIALRNVLANKRRTLFITIAIAIGSTIIIMANSLSTGVRENMIKNSFALFTSHVNVYGIDRVRGEDILRIPNLDSVSEVVEENFPDAKIIYRTVVSGQMYNPNKNVNFKNSMMLGVDIDKEFLFREAVAMANCDILPAEIDKNRFENDILPSISNEEKKKILKQNYIKNETEDMYSVNLQPDTSEDELIKILKNSGYTIETEECGTMESINKPNYALIDTDIARELELKVGDTFTFEGMIETKDLGLVNNSMDLTIGGIIQGMGQMGFFSMFRVSNETANDFLMTEKPQTSRIAIFLDDKSKSYEAADKLEEKLKILAEKEGFEVDEKDRSDNGLDTVEDAQASIEERLKEKQDGLTIRVRTWQEEISFLEEMINTLDLVFLILIIILMIIILMGISNTLIMSIRDRTGEIGTLRAIGMHKPSVLLMFILEGIILGFFGSLIGVLIGGSLSWLFTVNGIYIGPSPISIFLIDNTLFFKLTWGTILMNFIFVIVVSVIASIYPSYQASKLKPITAMQKE